MYFFIFYLFFFFERTECPSYIVGINITAASGFHFPFAVKQLGTRQGSPILVASSRG